MAQKRIRPSLRDGITNLRRADSIRDALLGLFGRTLVKVRNLDDCCGDYGAPGC